MGDYEYNTQACPDCGRTYQADDATDPGLCEDCWRYLYEVADLSDDLEED